MRKGILVKSHGKYEIRQMCRTCDDQKLYVVYNLKNDKMVYANVKETEVNKWISKRTPKQKFTTPESVQ